MWLSKMISRANDYQKAEKGIVTISDKNELEIGASASSREVKNYAPYGYNSAPPVGQEVILVPSSDGQVVLGTKSNPQALDSGEVRISSQGGASIVLKNDGTVVINSMVIDRNGVIRA